MIRDAKKNDIDEINKLGTIINNKFSNLFDMNSILDDNISKVYVYEEDSKILGFLHITKLYENVDIVNIVVALEYQKQKIATNLIDYMLSEIDSEVKMLTLEVAVDNEAAIKLYENFDFKVVNRRKNYYGNLDAYFMTKEVNEN